jgi:hypothetical protein
VGARAYASALSLAVVKVAVLGRQVRLIPPAQRQRARHNDALRRWASGMLERKTVRYKFKLPAVALANKVARVVFALMTRGGQYDGRPFAA